MDLALRNVWAPPERRARRCTAAGLLIVLDISKKEVDTFGLSPDWRIIPLKDPMKLYYFPPSSYSQKVLFGCYEKQLTPELCIIQMFDPIARAEFGKLSPLGKVPLLVLENGSVLPESSIILEYLDARFDTGTRLFPQDLDMALRARLYDRWFDWYVNEPMTILFHHGRRPVEERDEQAMEESRKMLAKVYPVLDAHFAANQWAAGDVFTIAECAAAPALRYCEMVYPFEQHGHLAAYWKRLSARPSYVRVAEEAAPYLAKLTGKQGSI